MAQIIAPTLRQLLCLALCLALPGLAQGKTVTDIYGRSVNAPDAIGRLIALGSSMSYVSYFGGQQLAVGVEDMEKSTSTKPYILANKERVKDLPVIGKAGAVRIPNYEEIIRLRPDVIFIVSTDRGEPDLVQRKTGVPVVAVGHGTAYFDQAAFLRSIEITGEVLGRQERARELVDYIHSLAEELSYTPDDARLATAYVGGLSYKGNQGIVSTAANFLPMNLAHVRNVADATGSTGHMFINKEFLLNVDPPLMFLDGNGLGIIRETVASDPAYFARFNALRGGAAYVLLPNTSYFTNPEMLYINAFFLAKIAYPDAYRELDPIAKADEVFTTLLGAPLYRNYVEQGYEYAGVTVENASVTLTPWAATQAP